MDTKALRQKILDLAIRGKLVPQDTNDEPASVLLEKIRLEKQRMVKEGKLKAKDIKNDTIIFKGEDNLHYEQFGDGSVKCIEDEIPFEEPEGWAWTRLSEVIDLFSGQDLTPDKYNDRENGIPYITGASNLSNGSVIINRWTESPTVHAKAGDLLLTCKGSGVGKMAFSNIDDAHIARQIMALRCKIAIERNYLELVISAMINDITAQANGIIPGIRREIVLGSMIPLPPYNEQIAIANHVSSVLKLLNSIELDKTDLQSTIQITKAKILDLAIRGKLVPQDPNDEPASVLLERIRTEKEELIKQGKIKRAKKESVIFKGDDNSYYQAGNSNALKMPFCIPETWRWSNLQELCDYGTCISVSGEDIPEDAWILDLEDIEKDSGKILQRLTNKERKTTSTKHVFQKGMVLYSKLRPYLNKVIVADEDGYCTSEILPLNFDKQILPQYAQILLMSPYFVGYANHCSYGMKMPRLGTRDGQNAYFPIPPYEEQYRIVNTVKKLLDNLHDIEEAIC